MKYLSRETAGAVCLMLAAGSGLALATQKDDQDGKAQDAKRPKFTLKAQPQYGLSPARIVLTAELVGGDDDFQDYYCPTIGWDWGDDTSSESTTDCAPFEPGKTEIKRRFTVQHTFRRAGAYKVYVRLKQKTREVATTSTTIQIQPGAGDLNR